MFRDGRTRFHFVSVNNDLSKIPTPLLRMLQNRANLVDGLNLMNGLDPLIASSFPELPEPEPEPVPELVALPLTPPPPPAPAPTLRDPNILDALMRLKERAARMMKKVPGKEPLHFPLFERPDHPNVQAAVKGYTYFKRSQHTSPILRPLSKDE